MATSAPPVLPLRDRRLVLGGLVLISLVMTLASGGWAFRFPHQRVVVLPGRHNLLQEQPAATAAAVRTFVAALPGRR